MLRPWVPLIALALMAALGYGLGDGFLSLVGGGLLGLALASELAARVTPAFRRVRAWLSRGSALKRAAKLDWSVIDNSVSGARLRRDCERPETLGVCTGLECLVYWSCDFNIKKRLP